MTDTRPGMLCLAVTAALALCPLAGRAADATHASLAGAWQLNHAESDMGGDSPADGEFGGSPPGRPGGGLGRPGGGGFAGRGGGMGPGYRRGPGADGDRERMRDRIERLRAVFEPVERFTITQDAETVTLVDGQGRSEKLVPNGKKEKHLVGNTQAELKTTWQDGRLVSDISLGDGLRIRRSIGVDTVTDGVRRLTIELKPVGGRGADRPVKRVYDSID